MNIRTPQSGDAARIAKSYLKTQGIDLKHAQALELIARLHGYTDNQAMQADQNFQDPLALVAEGSGDFKLVGAPRAGVYVSVESVSVHIHRDEDGVRVDLLPLGSEMDEPLDWAYVEFEAARAEAGGRQAVADLLATELAEQGFTEADLDDLVHEFIGGQRATNINNGGLAQQLFELVGEFEESARGEVSEALSPLFNLLAQACPGYLQQVELPAPYTRPAH